MILVPLDWVGWVGYRFILISDNSILIQFTSVYFINIIVSMHDDGPG